MNHHLRRLTIGTIAATLISCSGTTLTTAADLSFTEVLPLYNQRIKVESVAASDRGRINPQAMTLPDNVVLTNVNSGLRVDALTNDVVFKDIVIRSPASLGEVEIAVEPLGVEGLTVTPRLVTSWYQSSTHAKKRQDGGALTFELLLSDDRESPGEGMWRKSSEGGWIYHPPAVPLGDTLNTTLAQEVPKRLLLRFDVASHVRPGVYRTRLNVRRTGQSGGALSTLPIDIQVDPVTLSESVDDRYMLTLYTAFKMNTKQDRPRAYVNTMRLPGNQAQRRTLMRRYLEDIRQHGFNGITIRDWDRPNLGATLDMAQDLGYRDIIVHATTPTKKTAGSKPFPIINAGVVEEFSNRNMDAMFYGFDEVGGNKMLSQQLAMNREIHRLGGESVNAVFWSDLPNAEETIGSDQTQCFDVIAHSIGSHGHRDMLSALPFRKRTNSCPQSNTRHVVYWHPHIENPTVNRMLMGFWLWASGFDGVIPHGYYFPSHIEKVLTRADRQRGTSNAASPFNDWTYWLPPDDLRHHNAVYPSQAGPIGTLEWEGILDGYTDLKYVVSLEALLDRESTSAATRNQIRALLAEIRNQMLKIRSAYADDRKSVRYLQQMEGWRLRIRRLLQQNASDS